jgi:acyl-CoA reductase-like NAD-dependent aldehyde dehydrogenase
MTFPTQPLMTDASDKDRFIISSKLTCVGAPLGGIKQSGAGRENNQAAINHHRPRTSVRFGGPF